MNISELLQALRAEVEAAQPDLAAAAAAIAAAGADEGAAEAREAYTGQVERLGQTAGLMGLTGLQACCERVNESLAVQPAGAAQHAFFDAWLPLVAAYLQAPADAATRTALAAHFTAGPLPMEADEAAALAGLLAETPKITQELKDAEAPPRPTVAEEADVSLALPADLNQNMFDGFMQEAPGHATDFSALVNRLAAEGALPEILRDAKRIAHTFKGSANIIGIKGIGRLGHYTEDILEALEKRPGRLPEALASALLDAAGCLEQMVYALLGQEEAPTDARATVQRVLDWANRLEHGDVGEEVAAAALASLPLPTPVETSTPVKNQQPNQQPLQAGEQALRIPVKTVDDLFRLSGELTIKLGQFHSRMRQANQRARTILTQNLAVQKRVFELENLVDVRGLATMRGGAGEAAADASFDPLEMDQYNELHQVSRALSEETADARALGTGIEEDIAQLGSILLQQERLVRDLQHLALGTRMAPVKSILPRLQRNLRQTCQATGKKAELMIEGGDSLIDGEVLNKLADPLLHILRNAVDHGIELPEERVALGKPATGRIALSFARHGQGMLVRCADDGRGLDYAAIRAKGVARGLLAEGQETSDAELARLVMLPGFSTRDRVTEISGRGVGLDVVRTRVIAMKGSVEIRSAGAGRGTGIELRLPASMLAMHTLLAEAAGQTYGLPSYGVAHVLAPDTAQTVSIGEQLHVRHAGELYPVWTLAQLAGADSAAADPKLQCAVLLRVDDKAAAVMVDKVLDARDVVAKDMGAYVRNVKGLAGAAILGDGAVAPLLDLAEMLRAPALGFAGEGAQAAGEAARIEQLRILVVDDSLSVRNTLTELIEDAGYSVRSAKDGLEAARLVDSFRPDLVLTDLEMPNMNGLELTAHLRGRADTRELPVVMITSRSQGKHREHAQRAGVNAYLTKPYSESELMGHIQSLLATRIQEGRHAEHAAA